jgi:hypothetical protein
MNILLNFQKKILDSDTVYSSELSGPGQDLFNFMADKLREFMIEHQLLGHRSSTFSCSFSKKTLSPSTNDISKCSVVEPHHFYAAPAPGQNVDAAPAPALALAPAPTLLYREAKFL